RIRRTKRLDLVPHCLWNLDRSEIDRLLYPLRPAHTSDGNGDARIAQRELQRSGRQRNVISLTDRFDGECPLDHCRRRGPIEVARIVPRSSRKDAAAIRGGVQDGNPSLMRVAE